MKPNREKPNFERESPKRFFNISDIEKSLSEKTQQRKEKNEIKENPYTEREIKNHIRHLKEKIEELEKLGYTKEDWKIRYLQKSLDSWLELEKPLFGTETIATFRINETERERSLSLKEQRYIHNLLFNVFNKRES